MTDERPLHVRVNEKLGLAPCDKWALWGVGLSGPEYLKTEACDHVRCYPPHAIPRYDTEWGFTGPLIERLGIGVAPSPHGDGRIGDSSGPFHAYLPSEGWDHIHECWQHEMLGATPLLAVCHLILALPDESVRAA